MRGKGVGVFVQLSHFGITPAYAGKSFRNHSSYTGAWDHPRLCGEELYIMFMAAQKSGSPPRMRGKDLKAAIAVMRERITPAYAGKSKKMNRAKDRRMGSPPRMRGKVGVVNHFDELPRITPAYAGKRPLRGKGAAPLWDHPRVCGEKKRP